MASSSVMLAVLFGTISVLIFLQIKAFFEPPAVPNLEEKWWGLERPEKADTNIRPFVIKVPDEVLNIGKMLSCRTIFTLLIASISVISYLVIKPIFRVPNAPKLEEKWWGPGTARKVDKSIRTFKINVSDEVLTDLKHRLDIAIPFQEPLQDARQHYGMNTHLLKKIVDFWKMNYNWREREKYLNQYPHFKTNIQGLDIHYIHVKPKQTKGVKVLPLMLVHGWPGSFREFYEMIPILTTPQKGRDFMFEVVIPSLPGYAFSGAAVRPGLNAAHMAIVLKNLMARIGFEKYYVQGGDWGSIIVHQMGVLFPDKLLGVHSNMCFANSALANLKQFVASFYPSLFVEEEYLDKMFPLSTAFTNLVLETGYMHLQATKPDTAGVALRDSPVGLASYILEKFTTWTNPSWKDLEDGGLTKRYSLTTLLDNVMIYWTSRCMTTSMRLYSEEFNKASRNQNLENIPITKVPTACAQFKYDLAIQNRWILEDKFPTLLQLNLYEAGHFPALEVPEILSQDVYSFVEKVENSDNGST